MREARVMRLATLTPLNTLTPLYLCRDKIKGQSGKNATLTSTKTLPKK